VGPGPARGASSAQVPLGLEDVLKGTDLLVLHSGWTLRMDASERPCRRPLPEIWEWPMFSSHAALTRRSHFVARKRWLKRIWWGAAFS
jgi:hypothetical protein